MINCNCFACKQQREYENSITGMYEVPIYKCINQKEMKTKTIEIKLPQIEGAELKDVTTNIENGYVVAEYGEKEKEQKLKRGDIVSVVHPIKGKWIFIHETLVEEDYFYLACYESMNGELTFDDYCYYSKGKFKLATPEEQQILFDALAKEGKYWDAEALEVKDTPKEEIIKNIFRELRGHNISANEAYRRMHKLIPING